MFASRMAVAALFFVSGSILGNWVARIPAIAQELHLTPGPLGAALLGMAVGSLVLMPVTGWLLTRMRNDWIAWVSSALYAISLPLPAFAFGSKSLFVMLLIVGAWSGAMNVSMNVQAVSVERLYRRPLMASFHALFSFGGMVGAFGGGVIASWGVPVRVHLAGAAVVLTIVVAVAGRYLIPEAPPREVTRTKWRMPDLRLMGPAVISTCIMCSEGAMADWSAIYLRDALRAGPAVAAWGYAAFSICMAGGRAVGDGIIHRVGDELVMRAGSAFAAAGIGLALLVPNPWVALLGFGMSGVGYSCLIPIVFSAAGRTRTMSPGAALSVVTMTGYGGLLAGPPVIGFLAEAITLRGALGALVVLSLTATLLAATLTATGDALTGAEVRAFPRG